ncbi:MAG: hypothetical protein ABR549_03865 [Mycobacteriales bacterium]
MRWRRSTDVRNTWLRRPASVYRKAVTDVLGQPQGPADPLAVLWAHELAWRGSGGTDEMQALSETARLYDVPLHNLLAERARPRPAVVPASRRNP